jgi:hypothetical protein
MNGGKKKPATKGKDSLFVTASSGIPAPEGGARWTGVYVRLDERK